VASGNTHAFRLPGGVLRDQAIDAGAVQHMLLLRLRKEPLQRYADQAGLEHGQVPEYPVDTIIQGQDDALDAALLQ
jgi:hypothetical protein